MFQIEATWWISLNLLLVPWATAEFGPGFRLRTVRGFSDTEAELSNTNMSLLEKAERLWRAGEVLDGGISLPGWSTSVGPSQRLSLDSDGVVGPVVNSVLGKRSQAGWSGNNQLWLDPSNGHCSFLATVFGRLLMFLTGFSTNHTLLSFSRGGWKCLSVEGRSPYDSKRAFMSNAAACSYQQSLLLKERGRGKKMKV